MTKNPFPFALVLLCLALLAAPARAAGFPQCPPIGASPGCAVLITIQPGGSLSYQIDSAVGTYDGSDDTLVGVLNLSGVTVGSIEVNGQDIYGFDGDGLTTFVAGAPFGPTGYEGPGTSFAIIDRHHGKVIFSNGLPNQQSRYFSLEEAPRIPTIGINKDLQNNTGQIANDVEILLSGIQQVIGTFNGPFAAPMVSTVSGNTLIRWTGATIPAGGITHVGFTINADLGNILGVFWTKDGTVTGCAHQCKVGTHQLGTSSQQITYANTVTACESKPLFAGNLRVNWYPNEVPLKQLNPVDLPTPMRTDPIAHQPLSLPVNGGAPIDLTLSPPSGAKFAVVVTAIGGDASLNGGDVTMDFLQFPSPSDAALILPGGAPAPALGGFGVTLLAVLIAGVGFLFVRRIRSEGLAG